MSLKRFYSFCAIYVCISVCTDSRAMKSSVIEHTVTSSMITVGGKEFKSVKKSENSVKSEEYLVNRVPVEKDQYYHELHEARLAEMNFVQQEFDRKQLERETLQESLKTALLEKLIVSLVYELDQDIQVLKQTALQPYVVFDAQGVRSVADFEQIVAWLGQVQKNLKPLLVQSNIALLRQMADDLQARIDQVSVCLKKSIHKATTQCDDTAVLKELLALIEG
jgi:hypothetical protein